MRELVLADMKKYRDFNITAVNGDNGPVYDCIIYLQAPLELICKGQYSGGGDMYEQEQNFFRFVANRTMERADRWVRGMACPVLYLDGRDPVEANAARIRRQLEL